jgi:Na+/H+-translocating membrane pyrophosphatase
MTGKNISNFISYFISGFTTLIIFLILFLYQDKGINDINIEDIRLLSKSLIAYSFGVSTVTIGAKISCSIYGKGSECSLSLMSKI